MLSHQYTRTHVISNTHAHTPDEPMRMFDLAPSEWDAFAAAVAAIAASQERKQNAFGHFMHWLDRCGRRVCYS